MFNMFNVEIFSALMQAKQQYVRKYPKVCFEGSKRLALGYAWCFPIRAILKRITISRYISKFSTLPLRLHFFFCISNLRKWEQI